MCYTKSNLIVSWHFSQTHKTWMVHDSTRNQLSAYSTDMVIGMTLLASWKVPQAVYAHKKKKKHRNISGPIYGSNRTFWHLNCVQTN